MNANGKRDDGIVEVNKARHRKWVVFDMGNE